MRRLRLQDVRNSRLPGLVGLCQADIPEIANYANAADRRLIFCREAGNDGFWGTFAEVAFNVDRDNPYITLPRGMARIIANNWCDQYVPIQNQYYEYLTFGNGNMANNCRNRCPSEGQTYSRNNVVTFVDMSPTPQLIRIRITESTDVDKRALIQGLDSNNTRIYTQDGVSRADGIFVPFSQPFATTTIQWNQLTGIQKDPTDGQVQFYQVDPNTGDEVLLLTMEPGETTAYYRRYYLHGLPHGCCPRVTPEGFVQVSAIVKLDLIPVVYDTDYLLIQNIEAIIEEAQAVRYDGMDGPSAKQMALAHHRNAVRYLNGEIQHFLGAEQPAVGLRVFGSARLNRQRIGQLT